MPAASVVLPRELRPAFPDRCVVCGRDHPGETTRLVARDGLKGAALWAGWFAVEVPSCAPCARWLHLSRLAGTVTTIGIAAAAFAFGLLVLLPRLPGWATGLVVLGLCIAGFAAQFVWRQLFPPAFAVEPHDTFVEYEFRDPRLAEEFARRNGAVPADGPERPAP